MIIELDGKIYDKPEVKILDEQRENDLRKWGYAIIRFRNEELFSDTEKVLLTIKAKAEELKALKSSL